MFSLSRLLQVLFLAVLFVMTTGGISSPSLAQSRTASPGFQSSMESAEVNFWKAWNDFRASLAFREMAWQIRARFLAEAYFEPRIKAWEYRADVDRLTDEFVLKLENLFEKLPEESRARVAAILVQEFESAFEQILLVGEFEYSISREEKKREAWMMSVSVMGAFYGAVAGYYLLKGAVLLSQKFLDAAGDWLSKEASQWRRRRIESHSSSALNCRLSLEEAGDESPGSWRQRMADRMAYWAGFKESKHRGLRLAVTLGLFATTNYLAHLGMKNHFYHDGHWFGFLGDSEALERKAHWYTHEKAFLEKLRPLLESKAH
jgi:hypothetical protein